MAVNLSDIKSVVTLSGISIGEIWSKSGTKIWSSSGSVIYRVDSGKSFVEEVGNGASCLSPATTPSLDGWTFLGWREDETASSDILTELTMSNSATITLYAVFEKDVTVTVYDNTSVGTISGKVYYNNGNTSNATFALEQSAKSGWTTRGWSKSTDAKGTVAYKSGAMFSISESITLYGLYQRNIYCIYSNNIAEDPLSYTMSTQAYYNSSGSTQGATFTLLSMEDCGFTNGDYEFTAWAIGSSDGEQYAAGNSVTLLGDTTFYAKWRREQIITENVNLSRSQQQGEEELTQFITSDYVTDVNISGTLRAIADSDDTQDYRCDVILYIGDTTIGETGAHMTTESISIDYDLARVDGITLKLYVSPHSSDEGGGSFVGTVTYTYTEII